jgi:hypothetical protein
VNRALVDLVVWSARGRLVRRARLLRQPRYLIASLVGVCYVGLVLVRRVFAGRHAAPLALPAGPYAELIPLALGLGLAAGMTCAWLLASSKPALRLTETELDVLLPAPLPRRQIILYSLLRQQPGLLTSTLVIFLLRGGLSGGNPLLRFAGLWALFTLFDLHLKGVSLWKARLPELPPAAAGLRRATAIAVGTAWWGALLAAFTVAWRTATAAGASPAGDDGAFLLAFARAAAHGPAGPLLAPFRWVASTLPTGAPLPAASAVALVALVGLHVEWVARSRAAFEEATLERARRASMRKSTSKRELRARRARHREPFLLAPAGAPELAIVWKNLMLRGRTRLTTQAALLAGVAALLTGVAALFGAPAAAAVAMTGAALLCAIPLIAGIMFRNDLRADLLQIDLLRTWPVAGPRLVLAEVLAPAINAFLVMALGCGLVIAGAAGDALSGGGAHIALQLGRIAGSPPWLTLPVLLGSLLLAGLPVALLSLAVQNLAALLLPSWVGLGLASRRGTAVLGQRLLMSFGHLLVMAVAALPVLLAAGGAVGIHTSLGLRLHLWELPALAAVTALLVGAEAALVLRLAGSVWSRLDPSGEILAAAAEEG